MVSDITVFDRLALHPLVADMPGFWLRRLAALGTAVTWPAATRLIREGAPLDKVWLPWTGVVLIDMYVPGRGDVPITVTGADGVLGWSGLIPPYRSTVGAFVVEECRAVELRAGGLRNLIAEDPAIGAEFTGRLLSIATNQLHAAQRRIADFRRPSAAGRGPGIGSVAAHRTADLEEP
ncbi:cyclic nucleotide-binding domain-containing protein [Actinoplanes sp. LDG1-06]|uniref:Cyclic nucleotide-binding domain-containing protein n=1 Tax=Paractinoplanes ovalisporus TaxID=2810368 RepID=A0ABS2A995_9ACTN|nr:cyclic nucleotide-binding domain-containing protein [Actinoplanes ovalisporus]MBM2616410.1 cyclic nucleotide-binding domain-containing protein [Actinoplanes ovalisporus]